MDDYLDPCIFIFEIMSDEDEFMNIEQSTHFAFSSININNKRSAVPKVRTYERVLCEMRMYRNISDFKTHYRITLDMFDVILRELHGKLERHNHGGSVPVAPEKQLLVFLNFMGNQQSMRECGHFLGLSMSTVHDIINRVMEAVLELQSKVIQWSSAQKQQQTAREVEERYDIPGVIGFIDGTHIRLASAPGCDKDYYNRKGYPSMQLQAVVDNNLLIISAYTGWPGCTHDARVLRNSSVYKKAEEGQAVIQNHHILADNAYPLRNWLISPFKNYGHLTPQQRRYTTKLSSARQSVERCFGHLKGRFRRLKEVTLHDPSKIAKLIIAGCILHNLCVIHSDDIEEFMDNNMIVDVNECENIFQHGVHGVARRLRLLQQM